MRPLPIFKFFYGVAQGFRPYGIFVGYDFCTNFIQNNCGLMTVGAFIGGILYILSIILVGLQFEGITGHGGISEQ